MIKYSFKCSNGHEFDSWIQSADALDKLRSSGMISCAICGDNKVERALMSPQVRPAKNKVKRKDSRPLSGPLTTAEQAFMELRAKFGEITGLVGAIFHKEQGGMIEVGAEDRGMRGKATVKEVKTLVEDGVSITPLPWTDRKTN